MPLPPRRKRCSFGGKEGVWWRRKTRLSTEVGVSPPTSSTKATTSTTCHDEQLRACTTTTTTAVLKGTPEPSSATMISEKKSNNGVSSLQPLQQERSGEHCHDTSTTAVVEWDEALARPIYRRHNNNAVGVCDNNQVSSSSAEEESGDDDENSAPDVLPAEEGRLVLKRARSSTASADSPSRWGVRRTKTFGGRSRRPLSLLLSQHDNFALDASSTSSSSNPEGAPLVPSTVPLFEVNDRRGLDDDEEDSHGTASAEEVPVDRAHVTEETLDVAEEGGTSTSSASSSDSISLGASEPSPFEFSGGDDDVALHTATVATKTSTPMRPTANSSIEQAQLYFEHLDGASCRLQLDSSASPANSRPGRRRGVIRTTRKIQLSSPGFVKEYSKYAQAVQEMGVSPLKTVDYAKSRREFFRKAELFDGFVDS